jgi:glycosyltransferase involved in cell wall biosynthesis
MIDILMSTFNGSQFLAEQLDSILGQTFAEFRLMIRDDASVDDTADILQQFAAATPESRSSATRAATSACGAPSCACSNCQPPSILCSPIRTTFGSLTRSSGPLIRSKKLKSENGIDTPLLVFTDLTVVDERLDTINDSFWKYQALDPHICRDWRDLLAQNVVTGCTILGNAAARRASLPFELPAMMHDHWVAVNTARSGRVDFLAEPTVLYRQHGANAEGGHRFDIGYAVAPARALPGAVGGNTAKPHATLAAYRRRGDGA